MFEKFGAKAKLARNRFQAIAPFLAALFAWLLMRERVPVRTWLAMGAALAGVGPQVPTSPHKNVLMSQSKGLPSVSP